MSEFAAVLFDVDGVLVDSLEAHLGICRDKAAEYGVQADVPGAARLKQMLRDGVVISPMVEFFRVVGFSEELARRADEDYQREFMLKYRPGPFEGVEVMLERFASANVRLGIVTANTLDNVRACLGASFRWFESELLFDKDHWSSPTKAAALSNAAGALGVLPERLLFVGDQLSDRKAASASGVRFLGVSYGWVFDEDEPGLAIARAPGEIADYVLGPTR